MNHSGHRSHHALAIGGALVCATLASGQSFVNWESAHVSPLDVTPGGEKLLAVNTADNRLEVFLITGTGDLLHRSSIPVGLDPVSVRARTASEAWVVNKISDSVSIVNTDTRTVEATITVGDEPGDVIFAANRAFVTSGTQNEVWVYDLPYDPDAAPEVVPIAGEDPRSLATDGTTVYALIFNAGNRTTSLNPALVNDATINPYAGTPNPPPNSGAEFSPPINPALPAPPLGAMILKMNDAGEWMDDNGGNWSGGAFPSWTLHGNALAHIDATTLDVTYTTDLMTINMALDVHPINGNVAVVGTHAHNEIRFEPNLRGTFATIGEAIVNVGGGGGPVVVDRLLNPHIEEFVIQLPLPGQGAAPLPADIQVPDGLVDESIGDPRGVAWANGGGYRLVTGRGSNNLIKVGAGGARLGTIEVGQGPTGVHFASGLPRAYVLNQFDATISVIDTGPFEEVGQIGFFDPTPFEIKTGRPHLYDTKANSMFGNVSCATCHVDGAIDLLAWDLGDPSGEMKEFNQECLGGNPEPCESTDWHPMKGPMTTQTLVNIIGHEPFHWRGDREDLAAFSGAFDSLLGSTEPSPQDMAEFEAFVATMQFPPNPNRLLDGNLAPVLPNGGDPNNGKFLFDTPPPPPPAGAQLGELDSMGHFTLTHRDPMGGGASGVTGGLGCANCHASALGDDPGILRTFIAPFAITQINHLTNVPQLGDLHRKTGFDFLATEPTSRGTGYMHNGSFDTLATFLVAFFGGATTEQERLDVEAYLLSFSTETHGGVGAQATVGGVDDQTARRNQLLAVAESGEVGLVAKGVYQGERRGFFWFGVNGFASDRNGEFVTVAQLDANSAEGHAITYTLVPLGSEMRIGVDRDEDGHFDMTERDACSDPADPTSTPATVTCCGDLNGSNGVGFDDILVLIGNWGPCGMCPSDLDDSGDVGFGDILAVIGLWGPCE